jgi:hypothetical protein
MMSSVLFPANGVTWPLKICGVKIEVSWAMMPCSLVGRCRCFGGIYCFCLQGFTLCHNPENHNLNNHFYEILKLYNSFCPWFE